MAKTDEKVWNLGALYQSDDDPKMAKDRQAITKATEAFVAKWRDRDDYLTDAKVLKEALDEYEDWLHHHGIEGAEGYYFDLRSSQDQNDPAIKAKVQSITAFANETLNKIHFFELKLGKTDPKHQAKFLSDQSLKPYHHFLERIFAAAKHQLSEAEERIMNMKADTSYRRWVEMTSGFLSKEERPTTLEDGSKQSVGYEELLSLTNSQDKAVRDQAAAGFNDIMSKYADVAEIELNAILANRKVDDELRGFDRPDAARHLSDDIPAAVVDQLVQTVSDHNDIANRYYQLKAKLLGLPKLAYHERNIEYGQLDQTYDYETGKELVGRVFAQLDPEFAEIFRRLDTAGQIDVYPRKGKRGGAFCAYGLLSHPTYLLLNYTNKLRDVTTLAHEMGHAINDELMHQRVNALNFGTPMATAEVASQFMEDFVLDELIKSADDELRLAIMMSRLNEDISAIFRQIACYRFEQELHDQFRKQGYLSTAEIGQIFQKHMAAYMGKAVELSPGSEHWWVYWSHIRTFFYVYAYGGGLLIAKAMQDRVRGDQSFIAKVKDFMASGLEAAPVELFKRMGIDVTTPQFWQTGLKQVEQRLNETEGLAKRLGKL